MLTVTWPAGNCVRETSHLESDAVTRTDPSPPSDFWAHPDSDTTAAVAETAQGSRYRELADMQDASFHTGRKA
jgi:hypothetical protein